MRDRVEVIHGAVDGIDDPLELARLIAGEAFLAIDRVIGKGGEQTRGDQLLRAHVEVELDVVRLEGIDVERPAEVAAQEHAGLARRADRYIEW